MISLISILALIPVLMLPTEQKMLLPVFHGKNRFRDYSRQGLDFPNYGCCWRTGVFSLHWSLCCQSHSAINGTFGASHHPLGWSFFSVQDLSHLLLRPLGGRIGDRNGICLLLHQDRFRALWALPVIPDVSSLINVSICLECPGADSSIM